MIGSPLAWRRARMTGQYVGVSLAVVVSMIPVVWLVLASFKTGRQVFTSPPLWIFTPTLDNYRAVLTRPDMLIMFRNSLMTSTISTVSAVILGSTAAYGVSRHRAGGRWFMTTIMGLKLIPLLSVALPLFLLFARLRLIDTYAILPILYLIITLPFAIWSMKAFIDEVPIEIEESARIDGANAWILLSRIVMPLVLPGVVVTTIFCFIFSWNEFILALIFTRATARTVIVGISALHAADLVAWGRITASASLVLLPPFAIVLTLRRYLLRGLTGGALK